MANNDEFPLSAVDGVTPELPRSQADGEKDILPSLQWRTWRHSKEDSRETREISAVGVMVIHGVPTVIGDGENRTPDVWNTS